MNFVAVVEGHLHGPEEECLTTLAHAKESKLQRERERWRKYNIMNPPNYRHNVIQIT
jgi:hypothetical protein